MMIHLLQYVLAPWYLAYPVLVESIQPLCGKVACFGQEHSVTVSNNTIYPECYHFVTCADEWDSVTYDKVRTFLRHFLEAIEISFCNTWNKSTSAWAVLSVLLNGSNGNIDGDWGNLHPELPAIFPISEKGNHQNLLRR